LTKSDMKKACLLSLGCPRNLLDSEVLLSLLEKKGFGIVEDPEGADVAIVNTCGFIEDAKEESVNVILQLAALKKEGKIKKLVAAGCLAQRYPRKLMEKITEIDGVFGTSDFTRIPAAVDVMLSGRRVREVTADPHFLYDHEYARKMLTPPHYAYLKIQEGCSNRCTYCVIPQLKGPRRSRRAESVIEEARRLKSEHGIKELILIGQDTTSFGLDADGKPGLSGLIRDLSPVMKDAWIRLLYTHPAHFTDDLIDTIADTANLCKYVDLPIQHINDKLLQKMNRRVTGSRVRGLLEKLRTGINGLTLRTTVIVGFPGETDREFGELVDFLEEARFDRLGAFLYSREEGTPAAGFKGQVPRKVREERFDEIMKVQQKISAENNRKYLDKRVKALVDEKDPSGGDQFTGRGQMDAPEVDGVIYIKGKGLNAGEFTDVRITGAMEYDLIGEAV